MIRRLVQIERADRLPDANALYRQLDRLKKSNRPDGRKRRDTHAVSAQLSLKLTGSTPLSRA